MPTECVAEPDVTPELDKEVMKIQQAAFPNTASFAEHRWWHSPPADDDLWFLVRDGEKLVGSVRLVHRKITTPVGDLLVAGIGNVCSDPDNPGSGGGWRGMFAAQRYIKNSDKIDFGLLFCSDSLVEYYSALRWKIVENKFIAAGADADSPPVELGGNKMIYRARRPVEDWPEGEINLNGRNW